jgi:hypothetical protein
VSAYRRLAVALTAAGRRTPCQAAIGSLLGGDVNVLSVALLCVAGLIDGVLGRDWRLTQQVHRQAGAAAGGGPGVCRVGQHPGARLRRQGHVKVGNI